MLVSVLVPTYRRTHDLERCLAALAAQTRPADEVLVTVRDTDDETQAFFAQWEAGGLPVQVVSVAVPGVVAAMNAGLDASHGDILALTDDDAAPHPDWLAKIEEHFLADETVGGVGGRDWIRYEDGSREARTHPVVGRLSGWGRVTGNHHLGTGGPRPVDLLKGVNCAYRATPLRNIGFDTRLRGAGAQVHWELALGLTLQRDGWKLIYDPAVAVEHIIAPRHDSDSLHRGGFSAEGLQNMVYNETVILLRFLPPRRRALFLAWSFAVGTRDTPGLLQIPRLLRAGAPFLGQRLATTWRGRWAGIRAMAGGK